MTEYEKKLALEYSNLYNVPDVDNKRAEIEQELNQLKKELKEARESEKC